jgi:hypothetical protein
MPLPPMLQEARTIEELVMQRFERQRARQYFLHVSCICLEASAAQQEAAHVLAASAAANVALGGLAGCTAALTDELQKSAEHGALAVLLRRNAAKHQRWYEQATESFGRLT